MRVVDASVAVKWFLAESGSEQALDLLESGERLLAPSIIRVEVMGAISRRYREGQLPLSKAKAACEAWNRLATGGHLRVIPTHELLDQAVHLSFECRHALADCLYLAAAQTFGADLLTADRTLHQRGGKTKTKVVLFASAGRNG
jgi:predicted nucleic acid-binding protein